MYATVRGKGLMFVIFCILGITLEKYIFNTILPIIEEFIAYKKLHGVFVKQTLRYAWIEIVWDRNILTYSMILVFPPTAAYTSDYIHIYLFSKDMALPPLRAVSSQMPTESNQFLLLPLEIGVPGQYSVLDLKVPAASDVSLFRPSESFKDRALGSPSVFGFTGVLIALLYLSFGIFIYQMIQR